MVWRGDFETNDLSQWPTIHGLLSRLTVVTSPVRQGKYALRTELQHGDSNNNGNRNEVVWSTPQTSGMDRYYAWSTMFTAEYPRESKWQVFTQWHHSGLTGSPPLEMDVYLDEIRLVAGGVTTHWSAPLVRGVWHDFIVHVLWSSDPNVGFIELWYDGSKVLEKKFLATAYSGQDNFFVQGLYRDASILPTAVVYHDGTTVATALEDVLPPPPPPPPADVDAGTPDAGTTDAGFSGGAGDGGVSTGGTQGSPVATSGFPAGGCSSTGAGALAACGLGALLARRRRRGR